MARDPHGEAQLQQAPDGNNTWDNEFDSLDSEFRTHQTLNTIQKMLESNDPAVRQLGRQIVSEKAGAAEALKKANTARAEALRNQVAKPKGQNRRPWDSMAINRQ